MRAGVQRYYIDVGLGNSLLYHFTLPHVRTFVRVDKTSRIARVGEKNWKTGRQVEVKTCSRSPFSRAAPPFLFFFYHSALPYIPPLLPHFIYIYFLFTSFGYRTKRSVARTAFVPFTRPSVGWSVRLTRLPERKTRAGKEEEEGGGGGGWEGVKAKGQGEQKDKKRGKETK